MSANAVRNEGKLSANAIANANVNQRMQTSQASPLPSPSPVLESMANKLPNPAASLAMPPIEEEVESGSPLPEEEEPSE